jgi:hypothetical protein
VRAHYGILMRIANQPLLGTVELAAVLVDGHAVGLGLEWTGHRSFVVLLSSSSISLHHCTNVP